MTNLPSSKFSTPEFKTMTCDQWCATYLRRVERVEVVLKEVNGALQWGCRGRAPKESLSQALSLGFPELEREQYLILTLDLAGLEYYEELSRQIAARDFKAVIIKKELANKEPNSWNRLEHCLFTNFMQKHPAYYELSGIEDRVGLNGIVYGCYISVPEDSKEYDLEFLAGSRELHMDMLRESGSRSDAHVLRYHFAAKHILSELGEGAVVLDACCGMGYGTKVLQKICKPNMVFGVDVDERGIRYADMVYGGGQNISYMAIDILSDLEERESQSLDAIVIFEGLEHVDKLDQILSQFNRTLKPSGLLISSVPNSWVNRDGIDENPWHESVFDWNAYRSGLSHMFAIKSIFRQVADRVNNSGEWVGSTPCFESVDISTNVPLQAEWWVSVCLPRSVPGLRKRHLLQVPSFELQEAYSRIADPSIKTVSFDIFDTLLFRPNIAPEDVFYILQQKLVEQRGEFFSGFSVLRKLAEKNARKIAHQKGLGDITLRDIYSCLADLLALDQTDLQLIESYELEIERQLLKARLGIKFLYERALELGKKVIVISDMYLPSDFLKETLAANGYDKVFKIWVSSEHKLQKRTGLLYGEVLAYLAAYDIAPEEVLHIGDNKASDVDAALKLGMRALHTPKATERYAGAKELWPSGPKVENINKTNLGLRSFVGCQINSTFHDPLRLIQRGTVVDNDPYLFGRLRMAPFVYFAMDAFFKECELNNIQRVFFATRDGHIVKEVFKRIVAHRGRDIEVLDLDVSRPILNLMQCGNLQDFRRYVALRASQGKKESLLDLLASLIGRDKSALFLEIGEFLSHHEANVISQVVTVDNLSECQLVLGNIWNFVRESIDFRISCTRKYLDGMCLSNMTAIWDVGYFHSIANILSQQGYVIGLSAHLVEISHHSGRVSKYNPDFKTHSFLGRINNSGDKHPFSTDWHSLLVELLLSDPSTASRTVFTEAGEPVIQPENQLIQHFNRNPLDMVHDGIYDAACDFLDSYHNLLDFLNASPSEVLEYSFHSRGITELLSYSELVFDNNGMNVVMNEGRGYKVHPLSLAALSERTSRG